MSFLVYKRTATKDGRTVLRTTNTEYSLAGRRKGLIYRAWKERCKPLNRGWQVSAPELVRIYNSQETYETMRLLIHWNPDARNRVGVSEILDIYAYTWGDSTSGQVGWTPLMLRLRDVFEEEYRRNLTNEEIENVLRELPEPTGDSDFVEFLYLRDNWNWGRVGMVNATFIHDAARDYFRKFF